jgi:hypothetical protein
MYFGALVGVYYFVRYSARTWNTLNLHSSVSHELHVHEPVILEV